MAHRLLLLSASLQNLTIIKKKQLGQFLPIFQNIFWFYIYIVYSIYYIYRESILYIERVYYIYRVYTHMRPICPTGAQ